MVLDKSRTFLDQIYDLVLLVFLSVVMAYGPDNHTMFIPAEVLFVLTFGIRFFLQRAKVTNLFVGWTLLFVVISLCSVLYAYDKAYWFIRFKSVIQVLAFANLLFPNLRESEQSFIRFLHIYLLAILFVMLRLAVNTPLDIFLSQRLGTTIQVNPNTVGYMFSIAVIISAYLGFPKGKKWYWAFIPLFIFLSILSGSRKIFILLSVGLIVLVLLQQRSLKKASLMALLGGIVVILGIIAVIVIEPLRVVIGQRFLDMIASLQGNNVDGSTAVRMEMVTRGLSLIRQKPIWGWGLGAYTKLSGFETYAHNNYIELLVSVGIIGTVAYYFLPLVIVVKGFKRFFAFQGNGPYILSTAIMTAMLFDQVARVTFIEEYSNILLAVCYAGITLDRLDTGLDIFQLFSKVLEYFHHPGNLINHLMKGKPARLIPDRVFLSIKYYLSIGKSLKLKQPVTYNEKLQWQKMYDHNPIYPSLVDKYEVRSIVATKIGAEYLVPLIGVYDTPAAINIADLPDSFVIKPTHTSGDVLFCRDKNTFDWNHAYKTMSHWMASNYYWYDREWPYRSIKPRIIIEHMIQTTDGNPPKDYKIFCFSGEPKMAFVASDRGVATKFDFFDIEWNQLPLKQHYPNSQYTIDKPHKWEEMLRIARELAQGLPQVRVDLYVDAQDHILFGELTLFHFSGFEPFEPDSYDIMLGECLELPKV